MKNYILGILFLFDCVGFNAQAQSPVSFFEEHIDFTLDNRYFSINGIYSFHNSADKTVNQSIIFPFTDKTTTIDSIRIINLNTSRKIKFDRLDSSVSFSFMLQPKDTVDINIFYRQKVTGTNKYIITSTQSWGKPLEKAIYTLTTAKDLKIKSFSYVPDSSKKINDKMLYSWRKEHFMPQVEFEVTIKE